MIVAEFVRASSTVDDLGIVYMLPDRIVSLPNGRLDKSF